MNSCTIHYQPWFNCRNVQKSLWRVPLMPPQDAVFAFNIRLSEAISTDWKQKGYLSNRKRRTSIKAKRFSRRVAWTCMRKAQHRLSMWFRRSRKPTVLLLLTICLDNLIKNAKQHLKARKQFVTSHFKDKLRIASKIKGISLHWVERTLCRVTPNDAHRHDNMGIDLTIVEHLMKQANYSP